MMENEETLKLSAADIEWLEAELDREPRVIPGLKALLDEQPPWE